MENRVIKSPTKQRRPSNVVCANQKKREKRYFLPKNGVKSSKIGKISPKISKKNKINQDNTYTEKLAKVRQKL